MFYDCYNSITKFLKYHKINILIERTEMTLNFRFTKTALLSFLPAVGLILISTLPLSAQKEIDPTSSVRSSKITFRSIQ